MKLFGCVLLAILIIALPSVAETTADKPKQVDVVDEASVTNDVNYTVPEYSIEAFKLKGQLLNDQLTEEQIQAEYNRYYAFLKTYNAAYDSLTDEEKEERLQNGPPDLTIERPANPEFDAFKKLLANGIKVKDDLLWNYDTPARLTSDDRNALNGIDSEVKDILLAILHNNMLPQIKPSFFESANEVLFVGAGVNIDNLSVVADTSLKAEVVKSAYVTHVREPYIVGYWDVGELNVTFTKPLSIYSIAKNGLTGKGIGKRFSDPDTYDVCDGVMPKLLPADLLPVDDYPQANNPIVEIYSRKNIPPQVNVRTRTHRLRNLLPDEELLTLHFHSIDINKDDIADVLVAEGEVPSQMYEGEFKFWSIYFINIKGNWYFADDFVTPECT